MRVPQHRLSAVIIALSAALLGATFGSATVAVARYDPSGIEAFKWAVGRVESGGRYKARNPVSGAYGKYQIMPSNWPSWARKYLGDSKARQTPRNQERVADGKFRDLHHWLKRWRRVAYWWLTGSSRTSGWSDAATNYVDRVMRFYHRKLDNKPPKPRADTRRFGERSGRIDYDGHWRTAGHRGYTGDKVRYATRTGSSATFTFTGRRVVWYGPTGPTRGKAKVYVDGTYVRVVNTGSRTFDVHDALFRKTWSKAGKHEITIVVLGTKGHPMVAIDEFVVTK